MSKAIEHWLSAPNQLFRSVEVTNHAHGFRVSLSEDHEDLCTVVDSSIDLAFDRALKHYPSAKEKRATRKKRYLDDRKRNLLNELEQIDENIKRLNV